MIRRATIATLLLIGLPGCDDDGGDPAGDAGSAPWTGTVILALPEDWAPVDAEQDPFDDRPPDVDCPIHGAKAEDGIFEVETDICHYGTFAHPIAADLRAGDTIEATVWHLQLWAEQRAEGHVALMLGDRLLWEDRIPIPGREAVYPVEVTLEEEAPAGTPLYFHVHNHGANSWRLLEVEAHRE